MTMADTTLADRRILALATEPADPGAPVYVAGDTDDEAFVALVRAEHANLLRTVRALVGDPEAARDLVQEAFARTYQRWSTVRDYDAPGACARRIAIRLALRHNQRRWRRPTVEATYEPSATHGPRDLDLQRALLALPGKQRLAVVLHYLEDRPVAEVATLIGCKEATAKVHLHRGRQRLAELLDERRPPEEEIR